MEMVIVEPRKKSQPRVDMSKYGGAHSSFLIYGPQSSSGQCDSSRMISFKRTGNLNFVVKSMTMTVNEIWLN